MLTYQTLTEQVAAQSTGALAANLGKSVAGVLGGYPTQPSEDAGAGAP